MAYCCVICGVPPESTSRCAEKDLSLYHALSTFDSTTIKSDTDTDTRSDSVPSPNEAFLLDELDESYYNEFSLIGPFSDEERENTHKEGAMVYFRGCRGLTLWEDIKRNTEFVESDIHVIDQLGLPIETNSFTKSAFQKKRTNRNNDKTHAKGWSLYHRNLIVLVHSRCLRLLCSVASFTPQRLWSLVRATNRLEYFSDRIRCLDYLELGGLYRYFGQKCVHSRPLAYHLLYRNAEDCDLDRVRSVFSMMGRDELYEEELLDYWMGEGAMFCFKRLNSFPITEALSNENNTPANYKTKETPVSSDSKSKTPQPGLTKLPHEILTQITLPLPLTSTLTLTSLSKPLRTFILHHIDDLIYTKIRHDPEMIWMAPCTEEEWDEWHAMVDRGLPAGTDIDVHTFPWLAYAKECMTRSRSMRNRRRVWKICKQMESLALQKGV